MDGFNSYKKCEMAEARPITTEEIVAGYQDLIERGISVSSIYQKPGSPAAGDMVFRNPLDHREQWLVGAETFKETGFVQLKKNFGWALEQIEAGHKVCRRGWNGKGMWITKTLGAKNLPAESFWNDHSKAFAEQNGGSATVLPYILLKTADDKLQPGWVPSQSDLIADDWMIA